MENAIPPQLTFHCPACGVKLTVDSSQAGITGPCPRCHTNIAAPATRPPVSQSPAVPDAPARPRRKFTTLACCTVGVLTIGSAATLVWLKREALFVPHHEPVKLEATSIQLPLPAPVSQPELPEPPIPQPAVDPVAAVKPPPQAPPAPAVILTAGQVLEKFLTATTWEARQSWMEPLPATTDAEPFLTEALKAHPVLQGTCQVANHQAHTIDHFFTLEDPEKGVLCLLVRGKEGASPKVFTQSWIDSVGGRLAAFAATPSRTTATFHVFASAQPRCSNTSVPSSADKLSVRLLASDAGKPIATAYASKRSALAQRLDSAAAEIRYGQPAACAVELRWNHEESAQKPYLEVLSLKDFGWTP